LPYATDTYEPPLLAADTNEQLLLAADPNEPLLLTADANEPLLLATDPGAIPLQPADRLTIILLSAAGCTELYRGRI
jgi:hypothetical protein